MTSKFNTLLDDFNKDSYSELDKHIGFKQMLRNICDHRKESFRNWYPAKDGFNIVTDKSHLCFTWINLEYQCVKESTIY